MLLRITDKLLQNAVDEVLERDAVEDFKKKRGTPKGVHLTKVDNCINSLSISFCVWNRKNKDGSDSQVKEFTSSLGSQKKQLLNGLPSKINRQFLFPETCEKVKQVWKEFEELYNIITDLNISGNVSAAIFTKAQSWINLFCSLREKRSGYERHLTCTSYHIRFHFLSKSMAASCFKKFSGQGVEKNNDDAKRILFQKSNKWEAAKDILNTESRRWELRHHER